MRPAAPHWLRSVARLALSPTARHDARHELRRRFRGEPRLPDGPLDRLLVLCHGNICRSPFAAARLAARMPNREVRSAGLHAGEGNPADPMAVACAHRMGVALTQHRSVRASIQTLAWGDLILVMQGSQAAEIAREWPQFRSRVRLLGDYLPAPPYSLPDPWGEQEPVFDRVFTRIDAAVERLAARIESSG
ncbi:MAG: low molecular weight phosphotyrosine protein phosphatase [Candidatus Binatia bacterium]